MLWKILAKNEKELEILIQTIRIYSQDIEIDFEIEKCAKLKMGKKKGRNGTVQLEKHQST